MFILEKARFADNDRRNVRPFVDCWKEYYKYQVRVFGKTEIIEYERELNFGQDLTIQNLERLLRWKDPKYLSPKILTGPNTGQINPRLTRAMRQLPLINSFRSGSLTLEQFWPQTLALFPNGHQIWPIFIRHIARPLDWPIADQHVYRAFKRIRGLLSATPVRYEEYKDFFEELVAEYLKTNPVGSEIRVRKDIDDALLAYGQFLKRYG